MTTVTPCLPLKGREHGGRDSRKELEKELHGRWTTERDAAEPRGAECIHGAAPGLTLLCVGLVDAKRCIVAKQN